MALIVASMPKSPHGAQRVGGIIDCAAPAAAKPPFGPRHEISADAPRAGYPGVRAKGREKEH
jgi:hypothetical protein